MITTKMQEAVNQLNARFVCKADDGDNWVFMKEADKMQGGCEDYSLYIAKRLSGDQILSNQQRAASDT